jgi:alanine racemase
MQSNATAHVSLANLEANLQNIRQFTSAKLIMLPVKANAYGHGMVAISKYVQQKSLVEYLAVASVAEGLQLRQEKILLPILVLGQILHRYTELALINDLELTISDASFLDHLVRCSQRLGTKARVHLKIDTGMGRSGVDFSKASELMDQIIANDNLELVGVMTHFASADITADQDFTYTQLERFIKLTTHLNPKILRHTANSAAALYYPQTRLDLIRPGIASYGYLPEPERRIDLKLRSVMRLLSEITLIKDLMPGSSIGYARTFKAKEKTRIAIVPVGYGDGYDRLFSNRSQVLINGRLYPVRGNVSMDQITIEIGLNSSVKIGDEVCLMDFSDLTAQELADIKKSIPYEILCQINQRVPRFYY